jgi:hypothetical protein
MNDVYSPPPLRDLPAGRLQLRTEQLLADLDTGGACRRRALVLAAAALALAAALLATPAFGLGDYLSHLIAARHPAHRPPELIQRMFQNMYDARPDNATGVMPAKARVAISLTIPGFGHKNLWAAPTRSGGYCSSLGCNRTRSEPFRVELDVGGATSAHAAVQGSRDQHVFIKGDTILRNARRIAIQYESRSDLPPLLHGDPKRLVWIKKPIDAGFFLFELPKSHWEQGRRPVAIAVYDSKGRALYRDTSIGPLFLELQREGYAPPAKRFDRVWLLVPLAALLGALAHALWRRWATR